MGNPAARVSYSSYVGEVPKLELNQRDKRILSEELGVELSECNVTEIEKICDRFMYWRMFEIHAEQVSDLLKLVEELSNACDKFYKLMTSIHVPWSDAGFEISQRLEDAFLNSRIYVDACQLEASYKREDTYSQPSSDGQFRLRLNSEFLVQLAANLKSIIDNMRKELETENAERGGFHPGNQHMIWLLDMTQWAKDRKYRHGLRNADGTAAPFVNSFTP